MVWDSDSEETAVEDRLALREGRFALIDATWSLDLPEARNDTVKHTRRTGNDESLRAVMERDVKLRVGGEVLVRLRDVRL